jgi:5-methylcytosine-specific restriction protein A
LEYAVRVDGRVYPSKALVGLAYGIQFAPEPPLLAGEWSGGDATAAAKLRELGFTVGHPAALEPPLPGAEYSNRTAIADIFGGQRVKGILRFPGETIVNVFSDEDGPYADDAPDMLVPFEYRGEGRKGHQTLDAGNAYLDAARMGRQAIRYWHRPSGGAFRFVSWAAVLNRCRVWDTDDAGVWRTEFAWQLAILPSADEHEWPPSIALLQNDGPIRDDVPAGPPTRVHTERAAATYAQMVETLGAAGSLPPGRRPAGARTVFQRNQTARAAVILRAAGRCEYMGCTGMPPDFDRRGRPILEVDHVQELAAGGLDHPSTMIALCPNCHAAKTRGQRRAAMRRALVRAARAAHEKALARG